MLPESVRMSTNDMDSWPALLHLTYNNFLILLHRPNPKASAYSEDYGPHDAEICSAAAAVIVSIFEDLREKDRIKCLWLSSVNALFTAMIQIRVELRFSNPVLAMNALRRFDSTMASLRSLAEYWLNAETILRVFESSKRLQQDLETVKTKQNTERTTENLSKEQMPPAPPPQIETAGQNWWPRSDAEERTIPQLPKPTQAPTPVSNDQTAKGPDQSDWRQLFSFGDSDPCGAFVPDNLTDMEDEWRQIYLHEPGMADYFHDSAWPQT
jgi:transcriptional regulatory protein AMDR